MLCMLYIIYNSIKYTCKRVYRYESKGQTFAYIATYFCNDPHPMKSVSSKTGKTTF